MILIMKKAMAHTAIITMAVLDILLHHGQSPHLSPRQHPLPHPLQHTPLPLTYAIPLQSLLTYAIPLQSSLHW